MDIKTKFNLGNQIYAIHQYRKEHWVECDACDGTGRITLKNGNECDCPQCYERGGSY